MKKYYPESRDSAQAQCQGCGRWVNFECISFNKDTQSSMCQDCINTGKDHQQIMFNPVAIFLGKNKRNKGEN